MHMKRHTQYVIFAMILLATFVLAACQPVATPTAGPTDVPPVLIPTKAPVPTNTPEPTAVPYVTCGTADKPCLITFVPSAEVGKITVAGQGIADWLNKETGLTFQIEVGTSFAASIEAMGAGKAQIGFLNTFSVLLADAKYGIDPALATVRKLAVNEMSPDKDQVGTMQPYYRGQFITQKDSGITKLADLKGKTFCFVDPNSTSGLHCSEHHPESQWY